MAESEQAILDLVPMPAVRDAVLSPRATVLLSEPETAVIWANAAAAQLFGAGTAAELVGEPAWAGPTFQRQLRDAARQIAAEPVVRGFRVSLAGRHEFIQGALWRVTMPDGASALVFECPDERRTRRKREHELAEDTLQSFGKNAAAAILDEYGLPVAYSEAFAGIDIAPEKLEALGAQAGFSRGILRATVSDEAGAAYAVSLATLREEPGRHLVIISKQHESDAAEPEAAQGETPPSAAGKPVLPSSTTEAALAAAAGLAAEPEEIPAVAVLQEQNSADEAGHAPEIAHRDGAFAGQEAGEPDAFANETAVEPGPDSGGAHGGSQTDAQENGEWSVRQDDDADIPVEWHSGEKVAEAAPDTDRFPTAESAEAVTEPSTGREPEEADLYSGMAAESSAEIADTAEPDISPLAANAGATGGADAAGQAGDNPVYLGQIATIETPADDPANAGASVEGLSPVDGADAGDTAQTASAQAEARRGGSIRSLLERWYWQGAQGDGRGKLEASAPVLAADVEENTADAVWVADENAASVSTGVFDFEEQAVPAPALETGTAVEARQESEHASFEDSDARDAIERGASRPAWEGSAGYEPAQADLDHTDDDAAANAEDIAPAASAAGMPEEPESDAATWVETESGDSAPAAALATEPWAETAPDMPGESEPAETASAPYDAGQAAETDFSEAETAAAPDLTGLTKDIPQADDGTQSAAEEAPAFHEPMPEQAPPDWQGRSGEEASEEPIADMPAVGFEKADAAPQPFAAPVGFVFASRPDPVRFAWTVDQDHVFRSVSPELGDTLGPNAADVVGRAWADVARVFGFDRNGDIGRLLEKRDTWSGKTVLWPVQGTDLAVPVDLAALPAFSGARQFDGFRGFGIIRTADAVIDPDEIGFALVDGPFEPRDRDSAAALAVPAEPHSAEPSAEPDVSVAEEDDFARALRQGGDTETDDFAPVALPANVVELGARKRDRGEELSSREARAFREIGQRLGNDEGEPAAQASAPEAISAQPPAAPSQPEPEQPFLPLAAAPDPIEPSPFEPSPIEPGPIGPGTPVAIGDAASADEPATPEALLEDLPVPVLVYRTGETLYANPELLSITGHGSLAALVEAGGVDALFAGAGPSVGVDSAMRISRADGSRLEVRPVLRRVPWPGGRALLLAFRSPYQPEQADDRVAVDQARIEELKSILDTATNGIIITSPGGEVESLNGPAQALFGVSQESVAGKPLTDLFAPESHRTLAEYMREVAEPGIAGLLNDGREVIGREAKGGLIPMFVTIGRAGDAGKYCAVLRDITHWKKAEEELVTAKRAAETASEQKSEFLARVSHEIRTPLNAIIGFSDVMIEERFGPIDNERYRGYLRDINRSGVHVLDLINDLLDISKIEAGKMELTYEAVDLNLLVQETVALLQPQANSERIIIRTSLSRAVPRVVADARSIRQIILNLVSNAIKFTPANGQVIVSTVYEGNGEVVLRVRDTGRGMTEREIEHAMKPFHQINVTDERRGQGTGLGLPLTKALVEANRAYFDLESTPGEGTIAHVHFPTQRVLAD